jgi:predicted nucleic acid-binding protein
MNLVVSDASPVRYLIAIDAVHILPELFSKVIIPEHVIATELQGRRTPAKVKEWASHPPSWVEVRKPAKPESLELHAGEEQAIALALELGTPILLDEKETRDVAQRKGLVVIGTIGLLELAASKSLVNLADALKALQETNMRVHPFLIQSALKRQAGSQPKPAPQEGTTNE